MIGVSACLCGDNCKYSGGNNLNEEILKLYNEGKALKICPECLGGLEIPRAPAELFNCSGSDVLSGTGKVFSKDGKDVTSAFIKGAKEALKIIKENGITTVILKSRSPSCGFGKIYNGDFSGTLIDGNGVAAQLFYDNGIEVLQK
ncbi:MAG: DUF523 domain-containing protein [Clostridia bacterium]|nr:DUF523 domain-containing protein [Clostridia bacterium]